jgi:hypothetical protein
MWLWRTAQEPLRASLMDLSCSSSWRPQRFDYLMMTMVPFDFGSWPPSLSPVQLEALTLYATTYAISHGLLYLPPAEHQPIIPSAAIHAPISLFPSPFPRKLFELGLRLQKTFNILYSRIAMDEEFLDQIMGAETGVGKVDDFIGQLWTGWKRLRDESRLVQVRISSSRTRKASS